MLRAGEKERVLDLAWELGHTWNDKDVDAMWSWYTKRNPKVTELPISTGEIYDMIDSFIKEVAIA